MANKGPKQETEIKPPHWRYLAVNSAKLENACGGRNMSPPNLNFPFIFHSQMLVFILLTSVDKRCVS